MTTSFLLILKLWVVAPLRAKNDLLAPNGTAVRIIAILHIKFHLLVMEIELTIIWVSAWTVHSTMSFFTALFPCWRAISHRRETPWKRMNKWRATEQKGRKAPLHSPNAQKKGHRETSPCQPAHIFRRWSDFELIQVMKQKEREKGK